jgi:MFS family permease
MTVGISFVTLALAYGVWHSFSIFFVAFLKEFGWSRSVAAGAFSLFVIVHGIVGPFVGMMLDRFGPRRTFLLGSLFLGTGLALCSLTRSWWQIYLFFGVVTGVGVGATGWIPNATIIQQWFKEKRGLAMGIASSGIGIGIFVCVPSLQLLINLLGWRKTYLTMAFLIPLIIMTMVTLFLKRPPPITQPNPAEKETSPPPAKDPCILDEAWASRSWTVRQAAATKQFWLLSLSFFLASFITQSILSHNVVFFVDQGLDALLASTFVGFIGMVSVVGKIVWGALSDRIGREVTWTIGISSLICGMVLLITFTRVPSPYIPYLFTVFFGIGYAAMSALPPLITADFFEGRTYGGIFGTLNLLTGAGGACGAWFAGFLFDQVKSYVPHFIITLPCAIIVCLNVWRAAPRKIRIVPGRRLHAARS